MRWKTPVAVAASLGAAIAAASGHAQVPADVQAARDFLDQLQPSRELQDFLDGTIDELAAADPGLRRVRVRAALVDLTRPGCPTYAERDGLSPVYPASVVKLVYLMAAYAWHEQGICAIDEAMAEQIQHMIHESSNVATCAVFYRLTGTDAGPELPPDEYARYRERRLAVKRWLETLGIDDLHCVSPTYDNHDVQGRDLQFLRDRTIEGALPSRGGELPNRQAMTALGTAKMLALLATDRVPSASCSAAVRELMRRDVLEQPHLVHRLAGGAAQIPGVEAFGKTGTWGPIYADAGILRHTSGRQIVLVVFLESTPPYRGDFIADLAARCAARFLLAETEPAGDKPPPYAQSGSENDAAARSSASISDAGMGRAK